MFDFEENSETTDDIISQPGLTHRACKKQQRAVAKRFRVRGRVEKKPPEDVPIYNATLCVTGLAVGGLSLAVVPAVAPLGFLCTFASGANYFALGVRRMFRERRLNIAVWDLIEGIAYGLAGLSRVHQQNA